MKLIDPECFSALNYTKNLPVIKLCNINSLSEHNLSSILRFNATSGWLFFFFNPPPGLLDPHSPARGWTQAHGSESPESLTPGLPGSSLGWLLEHKICSSAFQLIPGWLEFISHSSSWVQIHIFLFLPLRHMNIDATTPPLRERAVGSAGWRSPMADCWLPTSFISFSPTNRTTLIGASEAPDKNANLLSSS